MEYYGVLWSSGMTITSSLRWGYGLSSTMKNMLSFQPNLGMWRMQKRLFKLWTFFWTGTQSINIHLNIFYHICTSTSLGFRVSTNISHDQLDDFVAWDPWPDGPLASVAISAERCLRVAAPDRVSARVLGLGMFFEEQLNNFGDIRKYQIYPNIIG
jgi:hypothetical protein